MRYLLIGIGTIVALIGGFAAFIALRGVPSYKAQVVNLKVESNPHRIEKGQKLAAMLCSSCHMDPNTGKLTGRRMDEAPRLYAGRSATSIQCGEDAADELAGEVRLRRVREDAAAAAPSLRGRT